jgi:hypothetical protein
MAVRQEQVCAVGVHPRETVPQTIVEPFESPSGWAAVGEQSCDTKNRDILEFQSKST